MNRGRRPQTSQQCTGWCAPTVIYLGLSVLAILAKALRGDYNNQYAFSLLLAQGLYIAFWTGIMYWLCASCSNNWSWFILLFPLILGLVLFVLLEAELLAVLIGSGLKGAGEGATENSLQGGDEIYKHNTFRVDY